MAGIHIIIKPLTQTYMIQMLDYAASDDVFHGQYRFWELPANIRQFWRLTFLLIVKFEFCFKRPSKPGKSKT
jgi:hypothetical protein